MTARTIFIVPALVLLLGSNVGAQNTQDKGPRFVPDNVLKPDRTTVLIAQDGRLSEGLKPAAPSDHRKFHVTGWKRAGQEVAWEVTVPSAANYEVSVLLGHRSPDPLIVEVRSGNAVVNKISDYSENLKWRRLRLNGTLPLKEGRQTIVLRLRPCVADKEFDAQVHALELVLPPVRDRLAKAAAALRADPAWFRQARYGLMFHWVPGVFPRSGDP